MPVAHPGCPMDHVQALANRSPGDLWVRCIGTLFHLSCRVLKRFVARNPTRTVFYIRAEHPFPGKILTRQWGCNPDPRTRRVLRRQNSPSSYTTVPPRSRSGEIPHGTLQTASSRTCCAEARLHGHRRMGVQCKVCPVPHRKT